MMARYIDATKLEELCAIMADKCDGIGESIWNQFRTAVEWSPTADVRENVHGKWIDAMDTSGVEFYRCNKCGTYIEKVFFANDYMVNFCPNCGAKMRDRRNDGLD